DFMKILSGTIAFALALAVIPCLAVSDMVNRSAISMQPNASFSLGADRAQDVSIIAVRPVGLTDVLITERGASPVFFRNCVAGAHYKTVTLHMRKAGGTQQQYLNFTLKDVIVTSVSR